MLRLTDGAKGMLWCSQVAPGHENGLKLRVYGEKGGLEWQQEHPNQLWHSPLGAPKRLLTRGGVGSDPAATRIPAGHPEGYLEGFATLYSDISDTIRVHQTGAPPPPIAAFLPGIKAGIDGMAFINGCVDSSRNNSAWIEI